MIISSELERSESSKSTSSGQAQEPSKNPLIFDQLLGSEERTQQLVYIDYSVKSSEYSVFRSQDFSWEDHGCAFLGKYFPQLADYLDAEFRETLLWTDRM